MHACITFTLHYITLHYITLHYVAYIQYYITIQYNTFFPHALTETVDLQGAGQYHGPAYGQPGPYRGALNAGRPRTAPLSFTQSTPTQCTHPWPPCPYTQTARTKADCRARPDAVGHVQPTTTNGVGGEGEALRARGKGCRHKHLRCCIVRRYYPRTRTTQQPGWRTRALPASEPLGAPLGKHALQKLRPPPRWCA